MEVYGNYIDGKKDGEWANRHVNDKLNCKGLYKNDMKIGIWEEYYFNGEFRNSDGKLWKIESYVDDIVTRKIFGHQIQKDLADKKKRR